MQKSKQKLVEQITDYNTFEIKWIDKLTGSWLLVQSYFKTLIILNKVAKISEYI